VKTSKFPLFIIASERSGTNLLRVRLSEAQEKYFGGSPAHLLKHLYYREPYFGPLKENENFKILLESAIKLCTVHFAPWNINWSAEALLAEYGDRPRDALFVMDFMMEKYANEQGRERYISKENFLYEFALDISARLPGARFIFLFRDPRDVVASQCIRFYGSKSVSRFARLWAYEQTRAIRVHEILAKSGLSISVSYEELITNEKNVIARLVEFLRTDPTTEAVKFTERRDTVPQEWENLEKPTMSENFGNYRSIFSKRQIKLIESICYLQMGYLGYNPNHYAPGDWVRADLILDRLIHPIDKFRERLGKRKEKNDPVFHERFKLINSLSVNYRSDR